MLKIMFNTFPDDILNVDTYFNNSYRDEWLYDKDVIQIVKDIDKSDLVGRSVISPVFGSISVRDIAGGTKALILLLKMNEINLGIDLSCMGQNCVPWLLEIGRRKDIEVYMNTLDLKFNGYEVDAMCMNVGEIITSGDTLNRKKLKYIFESQF